MVSCDFSASSSKAARRGKIYIDYLRNGEGATAIAPYSTRARAGASVATPIAWKEVEVLQSAAGFSIANLLRRLHTLTRDPWQDFFEISQSLTQPRINKLQKLL